MTKPAPGLLDILLHDILPPHEGMLEAKIPIRLTWAGGTAIGEMFPSFDEKGKRFGARIDITQPVDFGTNNVTIVKLTKAEIQRIRKVWEPDVRFELHLDRSPWQKA